MSAQNRTEFSAVLLAGGLSSRMGSDKANLDFDGIPLWRRQISTLRATGPAELFISGRAEGPYWNQPGVPGIPVVLDSIAGLGPLAGIAAALRTAQFFSVLILAVDLPAMSADFLSQLVVDSEGQGLVPQDQAGFQPLAAVYTRDCLSLAESLLNSTELSLQNFARRAVERGLIRPRPLKSSESPLFYNINRPADLLLERRMPR